MILRLEGLAHLMLDEFRDAVEVLSRSVDADPANPKALLYLSLAFLCVGDAAKAGDLLGKAIALAKHGSDFTTAIQEAEIICRRRPEISGATETLELLITAQSNLP